MNEQVKPTPRAYQANVFWDQQDCATLSAQVYLASDADSYIDALHAEAEALRAENWRLNAELSGALTGIATESQAADHYRTQLEAARGLLREVELLAEVREHGYAERKHGDVLNYRCANAVVEMLPRIQAFLTATPAPEVRHEQATPKASNGAGCSHLQAEEQAEQGERQEAVAFRCKLSIHKDWKYIDHRAPDSFELRECEIQELYTTPQPGPDLRALVEALEHARLFIRNGVELGYVKMPDADTPDPAHETLPKIEAALAAHRQAQRQA